MHPVDFILIPSFQGMETLRKKTPKTLQPFSVYNKHAYYHEIRTDFV